MIDDSPNYPCGFFEWNSAIFQLCTIKWLIILSPCICQPETNIRWNFLQALRILFLIFCLQKTYLFNISDRTAGEFLECCNSSMRFSIFNFFPYSRQNDGPQGTTMVLFHSLLARIYGRGLGCRWTVSLWSENSSTRSFCQILTQPFYHPLFPINSLGRAY